MFIKKNLNTREFIDNLQYIHFSLLKTFSNILFNFNIKKINERKFRKNILNKLVFILFIQIDEIMTTGHHVKFTESLEFEYVNYFRI